MNLSRWGRQNCLKEIVHLMGLYWNKIHFLGTISYLFTMCMLLLWASVYTNIAILQFNPKYLLCCILILCITNNLKVSCTQFYKRNIVLLQHYIISPNYFLLKIILHFRILGNWLRTLMFKSVLGLWLKWLMSCLCV